MLVGISGVVNLPNHGDGRHPSLMFEAYIDREPVGLIEEMAHVEALLRPNTLKRRLSKAIKDEARQQPAMHLNPIHPAEGEDGPSVVDDLRRDFDGSFVGCGGECFG